MEGCRVGVIAAATIRKRERREKRRRRRREQGGEGLVRLEIKEEHKFEIETLRSRFKVGFSSLDLVFIKEIQRMKG